MQYIQCPVHIIHSDTHNSILSELQTVHTVAIRLLYQDAWQDCHYKTYPSQPVPNENTHQTVHTKYFDLLVL